MRNRRCYRKGTSAFHRSLRLERFEDRLPFAVDGMLVETELWMSPADEYSFFLVDEWIALPNVINDVVIIDHPLERLPVEEVFSLPELIEFIEFLRDVPNFDNVLIAQPDTLMPTSAFPTSAPLVDEVFSFGFDVSETPIVAPVARRLPVIELAPARLEDAVFASDFLISTSISQASPLPYDRNGIEGLAIPVGDIGFSAFGGETVRVGRVTTGQSDALAYAVITELSGFSISNGFPTDNPTVKPDGLILESVASIDAPIHKELLKTESLNNQERVWLNNEHKDSVLAGTFYTTVKLKHFHQEYQSLGKILRDSGIELDSGSQLTIGKEHTGQTRKRTSPTKSEGARLEIAYADTKLPMQTLLDGMLPIGAEVAIKEYNHGRNVKLTEDFVAQTTLICDDLSAMAFSIDDTIPPLQEQSEKAVYYPSLPERVYWFAIGSSLIVTHVGLVARKSYERKLVEWIALKLPKFKKHTAN